MTRSGRAATTLSTSARPASDVHPALARLRSVTRDPYVCSSPAATRSAYGGCRGGAPVNPDALYPSEMLSPVTQMVSGCADRRRPHVRGSSGAAGRGGPPRPAVRGAEAPAGPRRRRRRGPRRAAAPRVVRMEIRSRDLPAMKFVAVADQHERVDRRIELVERGEGHSRTGRAPHDTGRLIDGIVAIHFVADLE